MKKITIVLVLSFFTILACHRKTVPVAITKTEISAKTQPVLSDSIVTAHAAGKVIYETRCIKCHEAKPVGNWNTDQWKVIMRSMIRKTKLDELAAAQVTGYVMANARK